MYEYGREYIKLPNATLSDYYIEMPNTVKIVSHKLQLVYSFDPWLSDGFELADMVTLAKTGLFDEIKIDFTEDLYAVYEKNGLKTKLLGMVDICPWVVGYEATHEAARNGFTITECPEKIRISSGKLCMDHAFAPTCDINMIYDIIYLLDTHIFDRIILKFRTDSDGIYVHDGEGGFTFGGIVDGAALLQNVNL